MLQPAIDFAKGLADEATQMAEAASASNVHLVTAMMNRKQLATNLVATSATATVLRAVAQGEYSVGLTFESNAYAYVAGGQKEIKLLYPEDGTFSTPEFLVLAKNAPKGAPARRAFDHIISKDVQIALLENAFRRPRRGDIDVSKHAELPNLPSVNVSAINENEAAAKRKEFLDEWAAVVAAKT